MNSGHDYTLHVPPAGSGVPLGRFLADRFRHSPAATWTARILDGAVTVDGRSCTPDTPLRPGQVVVWRRPGWSEPAAPLHYATLHVDDDLLVVDKPAGLPTLPGAGYLEHTLYSIVRAAHPEAVPAHRLGRWTSGAVVFARSPRARHPLAAQLAAGRMTKRYRALASGNPRWRRRRIAVPIGPVPHARLGSVHGAASHGRFALSRVTVLRREPRRFVCAVEIPTGRPHQIRIHLAAVGHPLAGDPLYGRGGRPIGGTTALPGDPGYWLHAECVELDHPRTGERIRIVCEPPGGWGRQPAA